MAASSASSAASKLLNFRNPALQNLIRRHLFHPSAAAATGFTIHVARNSNLQAHKSVVSLQYWPVGSSATRIEAARTYAPCASKDDVYEDFDDDDEDDDDDDVEEYSGSDIDDEDDGEFGDVDEDPATRTRSRRA